MNNKMKLAIAMMLLTASLSVVLLSTPSKVAIAQMSPENQTMIQHPKKDYYIGSEITSTDITQLRDEIRSNYPLLDAIADRIQTMDARETLRYSIGVEIVGDLLQSHAAQLIMNQTAGNQTGIP